MAEQAPENRTAHRSAAEIRALIVGVLAGVVRWVGLILAVVLVLRVVLTIGGANPANGIASFVTAWSDRFTWGFKNLFTPTDAKLRVLVNYGLAAIFWLIISSIIVRI